MTDSTADESSSSTSSNESAAASPQKSPGKPPKPTNAPNNPPAKPTEQKAAAANKPPTAVPAAPPHPTTNSGDPASPGAPLPPNAPPAHDAVGTATPESEPEEKDKLPEIVIQSQYQKGRNPYKVLFQRFSAIMNVFVSLCVVPLALTFFFMYSFYPLLTVTKTKFTTKMLTTTTPSLPDTSKTTRTTTITAKTATSLVTSKSINASAVSSSDSAGEISPQEASSKALHAPYRLTISYPPLVVVGTLHPDRGWFTFLGRSRYRGKFVPCIVLPTTQRCVFGTAHQTRERAVLLKSSIFLYMSRSGGINFEWKTIHNVRDNLPFNGIRYVVQNDLPSMLNPIYNVKRRQQIMYFYGRATAENAVFAGIVNNVDWLLDVWDGKHFRRFHQYDILVQTPSNASDRWLFCHNECLWKRKQGAVIASLHPLPRSTSYVGRIWNGQQYQICLLNASGCWAHQRGTNGVTRHAFYEYLASTKFLNYQWWQPNQLFLPSSVVVRIGGEAIILRKHKLLTTKQYRNNDHVLTRLINT